MEEISTQEKIIAAARIVFTKKGYAATRTRDIAEEANVNLALLNYYFKSKENLFQIIILEKFQKLFSILSPSLSNEKVSLEEKIEILVNNYMKLLSEEEDLPLFILNELKVNSDLFKNLLQNVKSISYPVIDKQLKESGSSMSTADFIMNIVSLSLFPYVAKTLFVSAGLFTMEEFEDVMNKRKNLIPKWIQKSIK